MECIKGIEPPEQLMQKSLEALRDDSLVDDDRIAVLERLADLVEDIDFARDFIVFNGPVQMLDMLKKRPENAAVRRLIALTIAQSCQQHDKVQEAFVQLKYADHVVPQLVDESDAAVRAALLLLCSNMSRQCEVGTAAFLAAKGLEALQHILLTHGDDVKSVSRALFLVEYLASVGISAVGIIEAVARLLAHESSDVKERASAVCLELLQRSEKDVKPILLKVVGPDVDALCRSGSSESLLELGELLRR